MKAKLLIVALILLVAFIFGIASINYARKGKQVEEDISWLKKYKIAHRGLHDAKSMENSISAFKKAIDKNNAIELDVHLTKDDQVVVFHDYNLKRMTGVDKNIENCTYEELKDMNLGNTEEKIPLLSEVLEITRGEVPILIEIKNEGKVGALEERLYNLVKDYKGKFAVQAFNPFVLSWYRENAPEIVRGQLSGTFEGEDLAWYKKIVLKNLLLNFKSKPAFISYEIKAMPEKFVTNQREKGIILLGWTARSEEEYNKGMESFDNIIYENIDFK